MLALRSLLLCYYRWSKEENILELIAPWFWWLPTRLECYLVHLFYIHMTASHTSPRPPIPPPTLCLSVPCIPYSGQDIFSKLKLIVLSKRTLWKWKCKLRKSMIKRWVCEMSPILPYEDCFLLNSNVSKIFCRVSCYITNYPENYGCSIQYNSHLCRRSTFSRKCQKLLSQSFLSWS